MQKETWKVFNTKYEVSNLGRAAIRKGYLIRSDSKSYYKQRKILKLYNPTPKEYVRIGGLNVSLHRMIWVAFFGNIPKGLVLDHIDGDRSNNRLDNLQLLTHRQNVSKGIIKKSSLPVGVRPSKNGRKYRATVRLGKDRISKTFQTIEECVNWRVIQIANYND